MTQVHDTIEFDTTDVDRHIGQPVGGGQLKEPVNVTDIRRWVQGMQYPNPLHYDDDYAARSVFGRIVAVDLGKAVPKLQQDVLKQPAKLPPEGEKAILEDNMFIEFNLPRGVVTGLAPADHDVYRATYPDAAARKPILAWPREIPIDQLLHKVVMVRDRLRVLEQKVNSNPKLSDAEKVDLQQYVTRCYGSLTTFNQLFRDKSDHFVGDRTQKRPIVCCHQVAERRRAQ